MANSSISVTEGTGKNIASYSISETTVKELQRTTLNTSAGVELGSAAAPVQVSLANTASNSTAISTAITSVIPGTAATNLGKAEDAVHASGDVGVMALGVGNEAQTAFASDGDYIPLARDVKGNSLTVGNLAHDAVDAGFPVKVGGMARTTNPTAVSDADRSNFITDKLGKQVVVGSIRDLKVQQQTTITTSTAETTVLTAVASTFLDVYGVIVTNISATGCGVTFKDSTSGTERFRIWVPGNETRGFMLPESGAHNQATVNNNWTATGSASVTSICITMFAVKNI